MRPIVQNCYLQAGVLLEISHCDGGVHRVVVSAYVLVREAGGQELRVTLDRPRVVEYLSRHHFEAIGVGPEFALWVEPIKHFEIDRDIFALIILDWYGVQFDIELNESFHML